MTKMIAALDSSGGSSGGVLDRYGVEWTEENKLDEIHMMRRRIVNAPAFNQDNLFGVILFKDSYERSLHKHIDVPTFLKIDNGLKDDGTMKSIDVNEMIDFAHAHNARGTKMRSVIHDKQSVRKVLDQQFKIANIICNESDYLVPIIEPEVSIHNEDKEEIESMLKWELYERLDYFDAQCILKLTPPEVPNLYHGFTEHQNVEHVVFLSGGYDMQLACNKLGLNDGVKASFSRALMEGLKYSFTAQEFNDTIENNINKILNA